MKHLLTRLRSWWSSSSAGNWSRAVPNRLPVLIVVEGTNDILFLKGISAILSRSEPQLPNLTDWEFEGRCLFLPTGGDVASWTMQLAALRLPQFYLFDRETGSTTDVRRAHIALLKLQPHLRAFLTNKRALENFLSTEAVRDGLGLEIVITDDSHVADDTAKAVLHRASPDPSWEALPPRSRKRRRDKAKRLLNTIAVRHMSTARLAARDPHGELAGWLRTIVELSHST